jgi:hypothetical protein
MIITFEDVLYARKISGLTVKQTILTTIRETRYIQRLDRRAAVAVIPDIPSFIIKYALAGCPPVADGVIDEKYMSDAE